MRKFVIIPVINKQISLSGYSSKIIIFFSSLLFFLDDYDDYVVKSLQIR